MDQQTLAAYWPFLVAAVLIVLLPLLALLLSLTAVREDKNWSLGKSFGKYIIVFLATIIWPVLALIVDKAVFSNIGSKGSLSFMIVIGVVLMGVGLYFSKRQIVGFGLLFAGLITLLMTVLLNLQALGRTATPVTLGVLALVVFVLPLIKHKLLNIDANVKDWGLGITHLTIPAMFAFVLAASLFTAPSAKSTEGMPEYPTCNPGQINPQTNKYEEDKACQDQLNKYYADSEQVYTANQDKRTKANAKRSAVVIALGIIYIILGLLFRKKSGAYNGLIAAGVIAAIYSIIARAISSTESVRLIVAILAIIIVTAIAWRYPSKQE